MDPGGRAIGSPTWLHRGGHVYDASSSPNWGYPRHWQRSAPTSCACLPWPYRSSSPCSPWHSLPRLTTPPDYVFDELYNAYTASKYVSGDEAYSTTVPPDDDP